MYPIISYCLLNNFVVAIYRLYFRHGDIYDQQKHPQGTEIKAITYSNMQIHEGAERTDLYVIVDI